MLERSLFKTAFFVRVLRGGRAFRVGLAFALTGCSQALVLPAPPGPEAIPDLEASWGRDSEDLETGSRLALAYSAAGRSAEADSLVSELMSAFPNESAAFITAGLLAEESGATLDAAAFYQAGLDREPYPEVRSAVEARLSTVRAEALREDVRRAISAEGEFADQIPDASSIGVFPLAFEGLDSAWAPLALAVTDMVVTDLALVDRLQVVERASMQVLVQELGLAEAGRTEVSTAARSGRIMGAAQIVQGVLRVDPDAQVAIDAAVVGTQDESLAATSSIDVTDGLERVLDAEKRLVFGIIDELGVELTVAERELINERQTESLEALLAFGEGLEAMDRGDYEAAVQDFEAAVEIDPSFAKAEAPLAMARVRARTPLVAALREIPALAHRVRTRREAVRLIRSAPTVMRRRILRRLDPEERATIAETLGLDRLGQVILLELTFRPPVGGFE
jgi:tetratricopeptide (TPR) repeat protein